MSKSKNERAFEKVSSGLMWFVGIAFLVIVGLYTWEFWGTPRNSKESYAQFGDYMGGILNPLLSFGAIFLLVHSIKYQLEELSLTRDEMTRQRNELAENNATQLKISKAQENSTVLPALISSINDKNRIIEDMLTKYVSLRVSDNCGAKVYEIIGTADSRSSSNQVLFEELIERYIEDNGRELHLATSFHNELSYFLGRFHNLETLLREFLDHGGPKFVAYEISYRLSRFCHVLHDVDSDKLQHRAEGVGASMYSIIRIYFENQPSPNQ